MSEPLPCTCHCVKPYQPMTDCGPQPAEWEQNHLCAVHGDSRDMAKRIVELETWQAVIRARAEEVKEIHMVGQRGDRANEFFDRLWQLCEDIELGEEIEHDREVSGD